MQDQSKQEHFERKKKKKKKKNVNNTSTTQKSTFQLSSSSLINHFAFFLRNNNAKRCISDITPGKIRAGGNAAAHHGEPINTEPQEKSFRPIFIGINGEPSWRTTGGTHC
jgi:hypothetical protein